MATNDADNPLINLIKTEIDFVENLALIVRKVASAWSRSNFPPPDIDRMFRIIESVYRINRSFLNNLQSTSNNFKLIGDSLLNFIEGFHQPYSKYVQLYTQSPPFSSHPDIKFNSKLHEILRNIDKDIDHLFNLPAIRLNYYLDLYSNLLSSTNSSKPDYNLLLNSVNILQSLVDQLDVSNRTPNKNQDIVLESTQTPLQHQPSVRFNQLDDPLKLRAAASNNLQSDSSSLSSDSSNLNDQSSSEQHQPVQSDHHSNQVQSTDSQSSSITSNSSQLSAHSKAVNLTHRLDTSRTLDIFSMQQKKCKLQIQPSFLPFKRGLVKSADVVLSFTPSTAPQSTEEIIMRRAHIFLLSDLFLVAERMTQSEKESEISAPNTDMWLSFPPLSGKFLKAFKNKQDNAFDLSIMKKETLTIKVESEIARDEWIDDIGNCTNFAFNGPVNKPPNRQSDESSQLPQAHIPPLINSPHTSPPITSPNIFPNNSPPKFPHPPPRDTFPAFDNVPMMGLRQVGSNGAFATPPPHSIDHQINQLSAANLSNMHLGPRPAQIRPISPGMIPPPPPPFNKLAPRSDGNQPAHAVLSERIPSVDTLQTESSKSLSHDVSGKFTMPSNLIGDIKSGKNKTDSYSPPQSPELDTKALKPEKVRLSAQMRCKVFLKHGHQAWKSLGSGGLKLYTESPSNSKQLVVESDKAKSLLISNYVLLDAVERVGKTGLAVEMSDNGKRTGIIYLIQLKSESSAKGLFDELVRNSSRDVR